MPTEAELALQRKYELLRKKKEQQQQGGGTKAGATVSKPAAHPGKRVLSKEEAARLLAARRAAATQAGAAGGGSQGARPSPSAAKAEIGANGALKLKFVIPKRDGQPDQPPAAAAAAAARPAPPPAPMDPARAAAVAALRAKKAKQKAEEQQRLVQGPKRPTIKRPLVRRPAAPEGGAQGATAAAGAASGGSRQTAYGAAAPEGYQLPPQQQQEQQDYFEPGAKRWHGSAADAGPAGGDGAPYEQDAALPPGGGPTNGEDGTGKLFVGDLPPYWTSRDLKEFMSEFGPVVDVRVLGPQCYGFVTFAAAEDAQGVLEFWEQQGIMADDAHMLRLEWAKGSLPEWKKGPGGSVEPVHHPGEGYEHPHVLEARLQAQQAADAIEQHQLPVLLEPGPPPERELVSYDDL